MYPKFWGQVSGAFAEAHAEEACYDRKRVKGLSECGLEHTLDITFNSDHLSFLPIHRENLNAISK